MSYGDKMKGKKKLIVMVSSSVYGYEELLDKIYTLLTSFVYEVWMSYKGTMPVFSNLSAFENCLAAVEKCDLYFGLINPRYGSGKDEDGLSITHREMQKSIELNKPRWLLAHNYVVFAKSLLDYLGFKGKDGRKRLSLEANPIIDDLFVIDMYEEAILSQKPTHDRQGDWVQTFSTDDDAALFATAQFSRYQDVEAFLKDNLSDKDHIIKILQDKGGL